MTTDWPFDPQTGEVLEPDQGNQLEYSVSDLSAALKRTIEDTFGYVRVRAELGRVSTPASGHIYLDLKDDRAVLNGVIWKGVAGRLKMRPEQGLEVIVTGKITTFAGQSRYQIVIDSMEPAGIGALMALLEERRRKLEAEGLFADERKKALPFLPETIGVVTSPTGAVIRDILHRLADRFPRHVLVWPVRVQGDSCAGEVAAAINGFNAMDAARPDLIIVARGGGSIEDLWGFNEEAVVRAAAQSDIPLISAIGHETDWTLLDHVADWRAPTPTAAAERAVPVRRDLLAQVADLGARNPRALRRLFDERSSQLVAATRALPRPDELLAQARQRFDGAAARLGQGLKVNIQTHATRFTRLSARINPQPVKAQIATLREKLARVERQSAFSLRQAIASKARRFEGASARLSPRPLQVHIANQTTRLDQFAHRADVQAKQVLAMQARRLDHLGKRLGSLSYKSVLNRGYAVVRGADDQLLADGAGLKPGTRLAIEWRDGARPAVLDGAKRASKPRNRDDNDQGSLL